MTLPPDLRQVLAAALEPFVGGPPLECERLMGWPDATLVALTAAGWRVVQEDDLRWLLSWHTALDRGVPPGVRALLDEKGGLP